MDCDFRVCQIAATQNHTVDEVWLEQSLSNPCNCSPKPYVHNRLSQSVRTTLQHAKKDMEMHYKTKKGTAKNTKSTVGPLPPPASLVQIAVPLYRLI